jgi:hypothetical protein
MKHHNLLNILQEERGFRGTNEMLYHAKCYFLRSLPEIYEMKVKPWDGRVHVEAEIKGKLFFSMEKCIIKD